MPNWCDNKLVVKGPKAELERFVKTAAGVPHKETAEEVISADSFIPYPKKFLDMDKQAHAAEEDYSRKYKEAGMEKSENATNCEILVYGKTWEAWHKANPRPDVKDGYNSGGYEWCIQHWGTKWGFCDTARYIRPRSVVYTFNTAWSPPVPLIEKMSDMFPKLTFILNFECEGEGLGKERIEYKAQA